MSSVDLMLLGALMKKSMSAYEMKKDMEFKNIQAWVKVSSPSIFKNLLKLHQSGFIDGEVVREGEMPEKTVYTINEKGKARFVELMQQYSENHGSIYIDFAAFLANLDHLDRETGIRMIEGLQKNFNGKIDIIKQHRALKGGVSKHALAILDFYLYTYEMFTEWISEFETRYREDL
ncbi:MAG TPA: PadR family transcriptional regulator [Clostridia bacterium]|nr:PadR family transcriptional regulator [Clostridia bacterium]